MRIDGTAAGRTAWTSVCCSVSRRVLCLLVAVLGATALAEESVEVGNVLEAQTDYQAEAIESQSRLDALDDETLTLISQYNSELARYEDLRTYNENMRQLLASQAAEKARLDQELAEVEVVRRSIVPLMVEMVDVLEQFIELDQPMLKGERRARLDELKKNLTRSDVEIAERYRRVIGIVRRLALGPPEPPDERHEGATAVILHPEAVPLANDPFQHLVALAPHGDDHPPPVGKLFRQCARYLRR